MHLNAAPLHIRRLDTSRDDLCAFEIVGHVSAPDIENLYGLIEGAYAVHERIDLLIRVVDHDGVEWGKISPETIHDAHSHAKDRILRCATVGDDSVATRIADIFSPPGAEVRHFSLDEEGEAWAWLDAVPEQPLVERI